MLFSVSMGKEAALKARMASSGIKEADLEENSYARVRKAGKRSISPPRVSISSTGLQA